MNDYTSSTDESDILPPLTLQHLISSSGCEGIIGTIEKEEFFMNNRTSHDEKCAVVPQAVVQEDVFEVVQLHSDSELLMPETPQSPAWAVPCTDESPGQYNFEIQIDSNSFGDGWVFSHVLNKLYAVLNKTINLTFASNCVMRGLYVRALPVFCEEEFFQEPVVRCFPHTLIRSEFDEGVDNKVVEHVLRIDHPHAVYESDETSGRLSVCLPLVHLEEGIKRATVAFKFACKSNCVGGMNSRPVKVIFTLEDDSGSLLGLRTMNVKICSRPKRDKKKEEKEAEITEQQHQLVSPLSSPTCAMPCTDVYPGPYDFEIHLDKKFVTKNCGFSQDLNKLFIDMNTAVHMSFKCERFVGGLFVRVLPVYCHAEAFQEPVVRCLHHRCLDSPDNADIDEELIKHVVHVDSSEATYECDESSGRLSVKVPLSQPQAGSDCMTVVYRFMCKNSCLSGMNRRPTEVIFTLENDSGGVFGRQRMKVRICSCPKRDKKKEEDDAQAVAQRNEPQSRALGLDHYFPKREGTDEVLQVTVCDVEYAMDVVVYLISRLNLRLKREGRSPNAKEAAFLKKYEQYLNNCLQQTKIQTQPDSN